MKEDKKKNNFDEDIYDELPIGIAFLDLKLRYLSVNKFLAKINKTSKENHIGKSIKEIIPELYNQAKQTSNLVIREGKPCKNIEFFGKVNHHKTMHTWRESWYPFRKNGNIIGFKVLVEDITERKKAEEELRKSKDLAEKYLDIDGIIVAFDTNARIMLINSVGCELLGYKKEELIGKDWFKVCLPHEEYETTYATYKKIISGNIKPFEYYENYVQTKKGQKKYVSWHNTLLKDDSGKITGTLSSGHDMTARKKAEEQLRAKEEIIKGLNNNLQDAMIYQATILKDGTRKFTYLSDSVRRFYGISPEEGMKNSALLYKKFYEEDLPRVKMEEDRAIHNLTTFKCESRKIDPSGNITWSYFVSIPRKLKGGAIIFDGIEFDITERKKAEEELRKAKENIEKQVEERTAELQKQTSFLSSVLENVPDMIFVKDAKDLKFELFNKAGEDLLGQKRSDLIGKNDYNFFPKSQAEFFIKKDREVLENKKLLDIPQEPIKTKSGEKFLHTKKIPILDKKGEPIYLLGISEDITEKKAKEIEYKTIIETAISGFVAINPQGKFLDVNDSYCEMIGYDKKEILKMSISDIEVSEKPEQTAERIKKLIATGHDRFETQHKRKDGKIIDVDVSVTFLKEVGRIYAFFMDITKTKKALEELKQRNLELERFNQVAIDRELKMVELKKKIKQLESSKK